LTEYKIESFSTMLDAIIKRLASIERTLELTLETAIRLHSRVDIVIQDNELAEWATDHIEKDDADLQGRRTGIR
jgi:hypothetical protein